MNFSVLIGGACAICNYFFGAPILGSIWYSKYKSACEEDEWGAVGRSKFYDLWSKLLPHISISTPSLDLCFTYQQNSFAIQKSGCLSEEEKSERLESAQEHFATCQNGA